MSHIFFGSSKFIIPNLSINSFASCICFCPRKQAKTGFFDFIRTFAVARDSVILCGVSRNIEKSKFSFSIICNVFS